MLDDGQSFTPAELLRSTRLCHAITYASCQGLTLRGRVWLCDALTTRTSRVKHLYVGASVAGTRARSCSRCSEGIPGIARFESGDLPGWNAAKKRAAFRSPSCQTIFGQHSVPRRGRKIPPRHRGLAGLARLQSSPISWRAPRVPCEPARSFIGGPGEPDNRRWLALKQSGNPLHFAGTAHRRERSSPWRVQGS